MNNKGTAYIMNSPLINHLFTLKKPMHSTILDISS